MATNNYTKYDEDFEISRLFTKMARLKPSYKEYGVSQSALGKWVKQYSTVEIDDGEVACKAGKGNSKNEMLSWKKNLILKAIAIFTPHSAKD